MATSCQLVLFLLQNPGWHPRHSARPLQGPTGRLLHHGKYLFAPRYIIHPSRFRIGHDKLSGQPYLLQPHPDKLVQDMLVLIQLILSSSDAMYLDNL